MGIKNKAAIKDKKTKRFNPSKGFKKSKKSKFLERRKSSTDVFPKHQEKGSVSNEHDMLSSESSDVEEEYEKAPRLAKTVKVRNLLPLKSKDGLVFRSQVIPENEDDDDNAPQMTTSDDDIKKAAKRNLVQNYAIQQKCLNDLKRKVALLCTSIIEDPENNIIALKELVTMLETPSTQMIVSEKKVLALSLLHVFSDVLPGYRIRNQEDEKVKSIKLKKETKKLLGYEQTLLKCYKKYIDLLYELIREMKSKLSLSTISDTSKKAAYEIGVIAVKCMCKLLYTRFSFNFYKNIANKLVPLSIDVDENVTDLCTRAFEQLFKADKLGEASFDLVKQIVIVVKERKFCVPVSLLRTFFSLNLREAKPEVEKTDMGKGRKEWQMMSRTERRDKKKIKELESELKEAEAYESVENVKKHHTATLNKIFWVFFHILKDGQKRALIAPALQGLSKFAYLINLEFFDDLNAVLCSMMENGQLSDVEKLHGVYTLFTILAGQAESLHIDPHQIYCHMYQGLLNLGYSTDIEHFELSLKCLEFNILRKKKKISQNRLLAFTKRVGTVTLHTPIHGTLGLLSFLRNIFLNVKGSDILLDSESSLGSGIYFPEMEDPEHCNPTSTTLWELHLLRKHYNPAIQIFSMHLLNKCPNHGRFNLPDRLSQSTPEEILHLFSEVAVENKMDFLDVEEPPKKRIKFDRSAKLPYESDIDLELNSEHLKNIKFFSSIN